MTNDDIQDAYKKVIEASQIQPADDEITILRKLLSQATIDAGQKDELIVALQLLVKQLQDRAAKLENIIATRN